MSFTNYEATAATSFGELTVAQKNGIVDDFVEGLGVTEIKHKRFIPSSYIEEGIKKLKMIEGKVVSFMRESVIVTPEVSHFDEETGETIIDTAAVYNAKPSLRGDLETLIEASFSTCSVTALDYAVDKIIDIATTAGTWSAFKNIDWTPST